MRALPHDGGVQGLLREEAALDRPPPSRILYLDLWSGAAGDMLTAALVDLDPTGGLEARLREVVAALGLHEVRLDVVAGADHGLVCRRLIVSSEGPPPARTLASAEAIVTAAGLPGPVTQRSLRALRRLADVEGALHGRAPEEVHFHELGAADTLVDVVGCLALVEELGVDRVVSSPIPLGAGTVATDHGRLGVPAPATLELLRGVPVRGGPEMSELTTPTGALLVTELAEEFGPLPAMSVEAVGYGGGTRRLESGPNVLRAVLGVSTAGSGPRGADPGPAEAGGPGPDGGAEAPAGETPAPTPSSVVVLEAAVDDATPEVLGHLHGLLVRDGALDALWTPAYMKKNRPGVALTVVCRAEDEERLVELVFRESTVFGMRRSDRGRHVLDREWVEVAVRGATVRVKVGRWRGRVVTVAPEYEDAARAAAQSGVPLKDLMAEAAAAARARLAP